MREMPWEHMTSNCKMCGVKGKCKNTYCSANPKYKPREKPKKKANNHINQLLPQIKRQFYIQLFY